MKKLVTLSLVLGAVFTSNVFASDLKDDMAEKAPVAKSGWSYLWDGMSGLGNATYYTAAAVGSTAYDVGKVAMSVGKGVYGVGDMVSAVVNADDADKAATHAKDSRQGFSGAKADIYEGFANVPVTAGYYYNAGVEGYHGLYNMGHAAVAGAKSTYAGLQYVGGAVYGVYDYFAAPKVSVAPSEQAPVASNEAQDNGGEE
ncbi:MAG: hypothetical protein H2057_07930 [Alphaproteobacteria bacterium]|nr:hypothetical protein [Alphaproteobacteria bacterium]